MKLSENDFIFYTCSDKDLEKILNLQSAVFASLDNHNLLRRNTADMFLSCVEKPNTTIGVKHNNELIGLGILYVPTTIAEDLSHSLIGVDVSNKKCANFKLCMVKKDYRGNNLQCILGKKLEQEAKKQGINLLCATVHPDNVYSKNNMLKLGYIYNTTTQKYNNIRDLLYKNI